MKIIVIVTLVLALMGCVSPLVRSAETETAIGGAEVTQPADPVGQLKEAFTAGVDAAHEAVKETPAYQAGKKTTEGVLELLAALGISVGGLGGLFGLRQRASREKTEKVQAATVAAVQEVRQKPDVALSLKHAIEAALSKVNLSKVDYDAAIRQVKDANGIASVTK